MSSAAVVVGALRVKCIYNMEDSDEVMGKFAPTPYHMIMYKS